MSRFPALRLLLRLLAAAAAGSGDSLLDHRASPELLAPACGGGELACDGRCVACAAPANAVPACVAGGCGFTCDAGFNACGGPACVPEGPASCGPSCQDCSAVLPAHAAPVCSAAHACGFQCDPGWLRSGAGCQQATAVSAGFLHTCALLADGAVRCWGANDRGQLGNGSTADAALPVAVALPGAASAIVSGYNHACAVVGGTVWCWGDNTFGQVGNGSAAPMESSPVEVTGLTGVLGLGAGNTGLTTSPYGHTCAILADRSLACWGAGTAGQLGDGGTSSRRSPVAVTVLPAPAATAVEEVVGGERHTCARTTAASGGAVYCWGADEWGQLGIGGTGPQSSPAVATIAAGAVALAAGDVHSCAVVGTTLECWGFNGSGQVDPTSTTTSFPSPRATGGLGGGFAAALVGSGRAHTCAQKVAEAPKCFGDNRAGQLGGTTTPVVDVPLLAPNTATRLTGGSDHTCALTGGGVQCWGRNDRGQLGRGTVTASEIDPAYVSGR